MVLVEAIVDLDRNLLKFFVGRNFFSSNLAIVIGFSNVDRFS
jgi:hypothetical protein